MKGKHKYKRSAETSARSFLRTIGKAVEPGSSILVVTEGVNTEPTYFREIRNVFASPSVELVASGAGRGDPRKLADVALQIRTERRLKARNNELSISQLEDFDQIWIVFDTDVLTPAKRDEGIAYARNKNLNIAYSEPCFEYWLLLHGKDSFTTAPMKKCANVKPFLKADFGWSGYDKNKAECNKLIPPLVTRENVRIAVKASQRVREHHKVAGTGFPANPSTDVDLILKAINEVVSAPNKFLTD